MENDLVLKSFRLGELTKTPEDRGFDMCDDGINIKWGGYEYFIDYDRIDSPEKLVGWIEQLAAKTWRDTSPKRIVYLIRAVRSHFGWECRSL